MRSARPKQLSFVFADSPQGGKGAGAADESKARGYLLHIAEGMSEADLAASEPKAGELMERMASYSNLAAAHPGWPPVKHCSLTERQHSKEPDVRPTSPVL